MIARVDVLGVGVSAIDMDGAVQEIEQWISDGDQHYVCVSGVHGVMESQRDPALLAIHNRSGLTTPDGMPLVWSARVAGVRGVTRVYGPELMERMAADGAERGRTWYLYGGKEGIAARVAAEMTGRHPGLRVVGWHCPPFRELTAGEDQAVVDEINALAPAVVWVGLSTPKQERWMAAHVGRVDAPVMVGVGAAFDIHAGALRQAPQWMRRSGLEWAFRLAMEPRRLARRYLVNNPAFLLAIIRRPPRVMPELRP